MIQKYRPSSHLGGTLCKIGSPLLSFLLCSLCTPLQVLSNKNFESVSNSVLTLVDCKSTESKSSIDFLLTDGKQYYIITAKRFFIGNRYDLSQLMPFSEGTSYSYTDCFTKVNVIQSGNKLCLDEERYVQPYILSFLFLCVVLMLNILGDKSTPEE